MGKLVEKLDAHAQKKSKGVEAASFWGLFMFVAIPLPGTGGWTGALIANVLNIKFKRASWIIALGILIGNEDNTFAPERHATRAETLTAIKRMIITIYQNTSKWLRHCSE